MSTVRDLLTLFGQSLPEGPELELEFSRRLEPGRIAPHGRFTCWFDGRAPEALGRVAELLANLGAPETVRAAQAQTQGFPVCHGVGVASGMEFRFYRHSRDRDTQKDRYEAWRWRPMEDARYSRYRFSYLPETPEGLRPESCVPPALRAPLQALLAEQRVQSLSGFWMRHEQEFATQLDIGLSWRPHARSLAIVNMLIEQFRIPEGEAQRCLDLHIKHIAFRLEGPEPAITVYSSAPCSEWPADERSLEAQVESGARAFHDALESSVFARLPAAPPGGPDANDLDLGEFYGGPIRLWQAVLGAGMHYHAGIFDDTEADPGDAEGFEAMSRAVRELYPLFPAKGTIYDIGCGWGGPMAMLAREPGCPTLGLTISRAQYRYIASLGLPVRLGDVERTLPPGAFSAALLLESLCHVRDKAWLLETLRPFCGRLVMRVNCQDASPAGSAFGGSMHMVSSADLRRLIEAAGWRIRHWRDRRLEAVPSIRFWHRRLAALGPTDDRHIETLRHWCSSVMQSPREWARNNPLIEVMAE